MGRHPGHFALIGEDNAQDGVAEDHGDRDTGIEGEQDPGATQPEVFPFGLKNDRLAFKCFQAGLVESLESMYSKCRQPAMLTGPLAQNVFTKAEMVVCNLSSIRAQKKLRRGQAIGSRIKAMMDEIRG
ncbi:hypothetical protein ACHAPT_000943 [Fusarium lateritium]